jgi:NADPH-dependent 7-cyano-7-deazaguanine reductase QueF
MQVKHETEIKAMCPIDKKPDVYRLIVRTNQLLKVEDILAAVKRVTEQPTFQEQLTQDLHRDLGCVVETQGWHSGFLTTVVCGE